MLKIYNSLSREKEEFIPIKDNKVGLYVCGMTVYDYCHLGHARSMLAFDVVVRYLRFKGYEVNYVRNITDIDDKIIKRAAENEEQVDELTKRFIDAMHEDEAALNILVSDHEPRATENIPQIINLIERLLEKDKAYIGKNGDVFFKVSAFKDYGKLSRKDLEGQIAGARVDVNDDKLSPLDFVLWKGSKPGEPKWSSPWGDGRPGWHIECSAMSMDSLGESFDIHGGGFDLQFPHHENEIAQSEGASEKTFAKYWMHAGFLQVNKEKMSKSLGNFFTIRDILKTKDSEVVRYFLISSHYRSQLNYSEDNLFQAHQSLERLYQSLESFEQGNILTDSVWFNEFTQAMDDDFNTPQALSVLFKLSHQINRELTEQSKTTGDLQATLKHLAGILGLLEREARDFLQSGVDLHDVGNIDNLIKERNLARANKDWGRADQIRDELASLGIELLDGSDGTSWRKI